MASRPQEPDYERMLMAKKHGCLIAAVLVAGALGLACYGVVKVGREYTLGMVSPRLFVSTGATEEWQAHFLTGGFRNRGISLFVSSASESQDAVELVEHLNCRPGFVNAVWSRDGTVIACRVDVTTKEDAAESARKAHDKEYSFQPPPHGTFFACAYDFRQGKSIVLRSLGYGALAEWEMHSSAIEELLKSRGGLAKGIVEHEITEQSKKLDWAQWQIYKDAMCRKQSH